MSSFPAKAVGALRLPVFPNMALTASSEVLSFPENSKIFLPLATVSLLAFFRSFNASSLWSLRLAGTVSETSILLASINLEAFVQLVQPFL